MTDERALADVERAVSATITQRDSVEEKFFEWVNMFWDRMSSVSGIAQDTLFCE